jgi:mannonate dehydratase
MHRRRFATSLAAGTAIAASTALHTSKPAFAAPARATMHVGTQRFFGSDEDLAFLARHGVAHIDGGSPKYVPGVGFDRDDVMRVIDRCDRHGISVEMFHLPLTSSGIDRVTMPHILLGESPARDREIEDLVRIIELAAETGVRGLNYNMTLLPVLRSGRTPGRGGCGYSTWQRAEADGSTRTRAGEVSREEFFERIAYFIERIIPAAESNGIQMASHIADPGTDGPWRGVDRALGTVDGLRRFAALSDSPYHGFNFCVGSCASGMADPQGVYDVLEEFGARKRLFNIHFRNIIGSRDDFMEVYPDNGELDMPQLMRVLRDTGYPYMVMPDHMPVHQGDPGGRQAFAFGYGYIAALIQAVNGEG